MANPFDQGAWDPFGELPPAAAAAPKAGGTGGGLRPARAAPPRPPAHPASNPFSSQLGGPGGGAGPPLGSGDDDPFGLLAAPTQPAAPFAPPSYDEVMAAQPAAVRAAPPPAAPLPPPPAYEEAAALPPPPSYEEAVGSGQQQQQQPAAAAIAPLRRAPAPPSVLGPLHEGLAAAPSRPAPARPAPARPAPARPAPARAPPAPPPGAPAARPEAAVASASISGDDLDWLAARSASTASNSNGSQPGESAQQQFTSMQLSGGAGSSSSLSCSYASIGNVGAPPKGGAYGGGTQQTQQGELNAHIRLPPLNPKASPALKLLAAGLGSLFAGPAGDASQVLQWAPREDGTTLPGGGRACAREDHDSAPCAELLPRSEADAYGFAAGGGGGGSKPSRVSCMLAAPGAGCLWCGTTDGQVHCWALEEGRVSRWLHSWSAHNGKVKALAACPAGRLFTGSANGSVKMWGANGGAGGGPPRLLRQLRRVDGSSGLFENVHARVVALAVSAGGRVLWCASKTSISLWSTHNGQLLGTMSEEQGDLAGGLGGRPSPGAVGGGLDIDPRSGLDPALLDQLFSQPSVEQMAAQDAAMEGDRDAATLAINAAVKGVGKAGKLLNKLGNRLATKLLDEAGGRLAAGAGDADAQGSFASHSGGSRAGAAAEGLSGKVARWGAVKRVVAAADGGVWVGYKRGLLERYSEGGRLLWSSAGGAGAGAGGFAPSGGLTALAAVGGAVWAGDQEGRVWVLDAGSGALRRSWRAHVFPVRAVAAGGPACYTLDRAGSVRAWPAAPAPEHLAAAWREDLDDSLQEARLKVLVGTWNVNETKPSRAGLRMWLAERAADAQLVMLGLQEVEMGTGSVALDVVYQNLARSKLEAGTQAAQAWAAAAGEALAACGDFRRVGLRQMSGVLVLVFARPELEPHIGEVATASVACGVMGYGGNKGGVAISFSLFRRRVVVVSSHFAAHQDKVDARNADYSKIVRHLHFHSVPSDTPAQAAALEASSAAAAGAGSAGASPARQGSPGGSGGGGGGGAAEGEWGAGVRDAELLVWVGDFNYRVDRPDGFEPDWSDPEHNPVAAQLHHFVHQKIAARRHADLLSGDQCIREVSRGAIFHGLVEGPISFMPTYKFEKGRESNALQPFYDQGEKKRVPAWTDRVFFRGSAPQRSALEPNAGGRRSDVRASLAGPSAYGSLMDVNDSDHKPVYAELRVELPWYPQQQQRGAGLQRLWQVAAAAAGGGGGAVALLVEPQLVELRGSHTPGALRLRNPSATSACLFAVAGAGPAGALPAWLHVAPAAGVLPPGASTALRVEGTRQHDYWGGGGGGVAELRVLGCLEGSVDSGAWPAAAYRQSQVVEVVLH